ncbi:peptidoglycan-binding protein [Colwellia sp. RSH04]|uniref:peptidoglycan-binding domain-containing protein n=1 Tax=Colwellia sp. RSH04 TaxID=2305464 RepID=UPI001C70E77F|nr:peptidoglycan-binding domain-containing protein [Colwellia sp. RSH04]
MSYIESAVRGSKRIEAILRDGFDAKGKGLHEYLSDVEHRIPIDIVRKARFIASVRNKVVHQDEEIFDIDEFNQSVEIVVTNLRSLLAQERVEKEKQQQIKLATHPHLSSAPSGSYNGWKDAALAMVLVIAGLIIAVVNLQNKNKENFKSYFIKKEELKWNSGKEAEKRNELEMKLSAQTIELASLRKQLTEANSELETIEVVLLKQAQQRLNLLGYNTGTPDGVIGPSTLSAIREFKSKNGLTKSEKLTISDYSFLMSDKAQASSHESLLEQARNSEHEYKQARRDISMNLVDVLKKHTKIELGKPDVSTEVDGSYSVRVPVSWEIPEQKVLSILNKYFNSYKGQPLSLTSEFTSSNSNRIKINERDVKSSSSKKTFSSRLFKDLQKFEVNIEVSLGGKISRLVIAGNVSCHVSCNHTKNKGDSWLIQVNGKPGENTISINQETPVVIKGLTKTELLSGGLPVAHIRKQTI